ncbi:carbohydrate ABC transporter membrane protein 2, CUT1 family [Glycomyces sambucus]|uniref:Carbohydrate ABC transporter membrane protein 2, CUT1 family n=2 Tax=Glycomyces sambucus TaxID=380244 RepID=A0A1G9G4L5_9ACTN|nr:carbohydrate ABC transporter permease [Glycomyces sambucus]SDK95537.1 carbohydrate ABC transporter membrane protein 2, CUT1 family [Glycomyces sambucus]
MNRGIQLRERVILGAMMAISIVPFVGVLFTSLHPQGIVPEGISWPASPQWGNYLDAWSIGNIGELLWSSTLIVLAVVPVGVLVCTMAGFALGHLRTPGRALISTLFLAGLAVPFESAIVPLYYQAEALGTLNTRWAIILPMIGLLAPFGVFWMSAHFRGVPSAISEAARMDGADTIRLFLHVHLPLALPAISTLALLQFISTWNQFLVASVLVDDPGMRTMAGALGAFQGEHRTDVVLLCAGAVTIMLPTVLLFLFLQRRFVTALLAGAVK